ncbi:hypothetical protein CCMSSC00406_0006040 [Pleurotus cornucopiae]|uniref:Uncharacterized protein n=1 Tax=Pleurotus cornucopiae TaxID=5321 RepID=A0ACB7IN81_PLECO|nr:hypothetical protein CCMSSC00406_0006040 [Pleurotus cornucopiae]
MGRLPPELVLLVFKELGRGGRTRRNCSLVCNDWRTFSLPFLYRRLYIQSRRELLACMVMMKNAPHIRPLIQEISTIYDAPDAADPEDNSFDIDDADIREFVRGFVHLHTISSSGFTIFDIPPVLPGSLVTALCIHDRWVNAQELSLLFDASANTIRSLTLDEVAFRDPPPAGDLSQLPTINMAVLEDREYGDDDYGPFSVTNLSIRWQHEWSLLDEISDLTCKLVLPYKIQHLEIVSLYDIPFHFNDIEVIDDFETFILDLHDHGSLRKLTFTFEPMYGDEPRGVGLVDRFVKLKSLGILDVRVGSWSILHPAH